MKKQTPYFLILLLLLISNATLAQWQNKSFTHQGNVRNYRVYKSPNYSASQPAALVLTLHGLGDDMTNFSGKGMNYVADTANIIVVVPQAMNDQLAGTAWNSGAGMLGYYPNSAINDVAFIDDLLDTIQTNYAINPNRVYACGFSMGGFFTNRLAVELNDRFTAFASVSGTFGFGLPSYNPNSSIRIAHFHGTADQTVPFAGNASGIGADSLVNFWVDNNNCNPVPQHIVVPDTQNDGYTIDHYIYTGGDNNSSVEFYKVTGADHVWLTPSNDIFYTTEIWKFFYKHQQQASTVSLNENIDDHSIDVYPNPVADLLHIRDLENDASEISILDFNGRILYTSNLNGVNTLSVKDLNLKSGSYLLRINDNNTVKQKQFIVE